MIFVSVELVKELIERTKLNFHSLAAGNGPHDQKGFCPCCDGVGQERIRRLMGQILLAGEEPQERSALPGDMVADRPAQHRVASLERVEGRGAG